MRSNEKRQRQVHYGAEGPHDHRQPEWFAIRVGRNYGGPNPAAANAVPAGTQKPVGVAKVAIPADLPADFRRRLVAAVDSAD